MTKSNADTPEYRRLTAHIIAECDSSTVMPQIIAVATIVESVEELIKDEPTPEAVHGFLMQVASILLMVRGFYDVIDAPNGGDAIPRDYAVPTTLSKAVKSVMGRMDNIVATMAARNGKIH